MGQTPKAEGIMQIYQLNKKELEITDTVLTFFSINKEI